MIPKRAVGALITTALALTLLFSFKTPESLTVGGVASGGTVAVGDAPAATNRTGSTPGSAAATAAPTTGTAAPTPSTDPTAPATAAGTYKDGTATGSVISTRFGDVQVEVTISGGAITDVTALQLPNSDRRSQNIASQAAPILREEALTAQSASIDLLSGATYTSEAYAKSLQSALDQVRA
ncbi:MAG: hypothetical protein QOD78_37 [Chloroflexota bacterium]|jgi:uncharacterized protein with FMN-binding domain|nr:hypothetical protein [Chloroflexota bacterium]MEA2612604.1 hypothetical protein [Chloroflexota bacterium]